MPTTIRKKAYLICINLTILLTVILFSGCGGNSSQQQQQPEYPTKPVELVVAFPPGGGADNAARLIAPYAAKLLGQPVNVVNKEGGGGSIGTKEVLDAKADGYTLLLDCHSTSSMLPVVTANPPFDWKNRTWIGKFTDDPVLFVVKSDSPWKTLNDVIEAAKKDPASFRWGASVAAVGRFAIVQLFSQTGVDIKKTNFVTFQGGTPTLTALAGGHIDFAAQQLSEVQSLLSGGKIRAIAIVYPERVKQFPDVPTNKEAGFPDITPVGWQGISGPPGLPDYVVTRWAEVLQKASQEEELKQQAEKVGKIISVLNPETFEETVMKEYETYKSLSPLM